MSIDIAGLLQKYIGGASPSPDTTADDLHQVAQNAPPQVVSAGVSEAFRSDRTPQFGQMIAQSFGQADPQHRATILNQLLANLGPAAIAAFGSGGGLSSLLARLGGGSGTTVTPDQASKVTPAEVQEIASHAEKHSPAIIERMSSFYAEHPGLVKTLGGAAMTIALAQIARNMRN
jgi:hypothetical protein